MTFHAFLGILSAVITGLTIVKVLQGILRMIHDRGQIKVYWVHLFWVGFAIFITNLHFWNIVKQRNVAGDVNIYGVADILWLPMLMYLLAGLLFPKFAGDHSGENRPFDLQDHYYKNHAWFFGIMMVVYLTNAGMLRDIITLNFDSNTLFMLVMALLYGTLAVTRNKWIHMAVPMAMAFGLIVSLFFSSNPSTTEISGTDYRVEQEILAEGFEIPWAIEVIGEDDFLITERMGGLYRYQKGELVKVQGLPNSKTYKTDRHYGGMMDISLHPKFASNQLVYYAYVDEEYHLSVARFELVETTAKDLEIIFVSNQFSAGSRIVWEDENRFFLTFGTGGSPKPDPGPQDVNDPRGKIFRLMADGSIPSDNPVLPGMSQPLGIWSYGHRDPQGLYFDIEDSTLYANEHGPMGGDELNVITKAGNYGWPLFSYGLNYDGTKVSEMTEEEAARHTILPIKYWDPSFRLAPSSLIKLKNSNFENWNNSFLMGGLAYQCLVRYNSETDETEIVLPKAGRIRDIAQLPSGNLVILIDQGTPGWLDKGRVVKLTSNN
jgi:glucose/arabinose dehydrogenase